MKLKGDLAAGVKLQFNQVLKNILYFNELHCESLTHLIYTVLTYIHLGYHLQTA